MRCDGNPTPLFFKSEKLRGSSNHPYIFQNVILALLFISFSLWISHKATSLFRIIEDSKNHRVGLLLRVRERCLLASSVKLVKYLKSLMIFETHLGAILILLGLVLPVWNLLGHFNVDFYPIGNRSNFKKKNYWTAQFCNEINHKKFGSGIWLYFGSLSEHVLTIFSRDVISPEVLVNIVSFHKIMR